MAYYTEKDKEKLRGALDFMKNNPDHGDSKKLNQRIRSGQFNFELKALGLNPVEIKQPKIDLQAALQAGGVQEDAPKSVDPSLTGEVRGNLFSDIGQDLREGVQGLQEVGPNRGQEAAERLRMMGSPSTFGQGGFGLMAQGVGALIDTAEVFAKTAAKLTMSPEKEENLKYNLAETAAKIPGLQSGMELLEASMDSIEESDPDLAHSLRDAGVLSEAVIGQSRPVRAAIETGVEAGETVGRTAGKSVQQAGQATAEAARALRTSLDEIRTERALVKETETLESIAQMTSNPMNKKDRIDQLKRAGFKTEGVMGTLKPTMDKFDLERAEVVRDFVDKDPLNTIDNLNQEIERLSNDVIRPHLQNNPRAFNTATINKQLKEIEVPLMFKADKTLENTYNLVRERALQEIANHPKTMEGLYDARIAFDNAIKRELGEIAFTDPRSSVARRAVLDTRRAMNEFITEQIGDTEIKDTLRKQHLMYEASQNVAEANNKIFETNRFQRWAERNPEAARAMKWGTGIGATAVAGSIVF